MIMYHKHMYLLYSDSTNPLRASEDVELHGRFSDRYHTTCATCHDPLQIPRQLVILDVMMMFIIFELDATIRCELIVFRGYACVVLRL